MTRITCLLIVFLFLIFSRNLLFSQDYDIISSLLDPLQEEEPADPDWIDYLWELTEHPLPINDASLEDLLRIPFVDPRLAKQILLYRSKAKQIAQIDELLMVDGMSAELLAALKPLLTFESPGLSPQLLYRIRSRLEIPQKSGFQQQIYHNPFYLQQRILFKTARKFTAGVIWEKDPGEANYFDYGSFYLQYQHPEQKYSILLGDFHQQYGNGLVLWSPYGSPFSVHSIPSVKKSDLRPIGNKSSTESGYLRGFSLYYQLKGVIKINIFYSRNRLDGNLSQGQRYFISLNSSGFHRTKDEIAKKDNIFENLTGSSMVVHLKDIQLQVCALRGIYNPEYEKIRGALSYQSIAFLKTGHNFQPTGEYGLFQNKFPVFQQSFSYLTSQLKFEFIGYYYHPAFISFHGRAAGSMSTFPRNRSGVSMIINYKIFPFLQFGGYLHFYRDLVTFPNLPGTHRDFFAEVSYKLTHHHVRFRYQQNHRPTGLPDLEISEKKRHVLRLDSSFRIDGGFDIKNFLQLSWADPLPAENRYYGISLYHQLSWKSKKIKITTRWSGFEIPSYDLRLYESEPYLSESTPSILLNGRGYKFLLLFQIRIQRYLEMDFKYGQRSYPDLQTVGSGPDSYATNRLQEIRISLIGRI